ncbi:hypothetical protein PR048_002536 [Dryococelus australis]|uniref:HAT C-terminal dimerisation domain-containing protein n=1 Tax=Dryococelus australis TaxID=614101 RepID=A0ABQ9ILX8_9NEOP|nr:hypothetical protein PR048_002536 [Dryococelus australis]
MSRHMKGAQAVISSKENRAIYIHCFSHSLNLALIHASSTNVLENVHTLVKYFNESAKRTAIFLNYKTDDGPTLAKKYYTVTYSLNIVNSQYETILSVLESLKSKESVANGLSALFEKTSIIEWEVENIRDQVLQICEHFERDLNVEMFRRQLAMLTELTAGRKINSVHDVLDSIRREQPQTRRLFSEVCTCLTLLLILPATSATAERTFSALRRLKTWLRSTMTQERLNHIAVLVVHRDLAKDVSNLDTANKFISSKESRKLVFGHIHI